MRWYIFRFDSIYLSFMLFRISILHIYFYPLKLTALFLRTFCSKVTWDVLKLLFVEVSRAGYAHTHTRDMEDTPDAQQCVNSHLHKLVFTVKIRCPSPINRGHACSPRRIPGMAPSHATGSRNRPLPPHDNFMVYLGSNISISTTDKPICSQITPRDAQCVP